MGQKGQEKGEWDSLTYFKPPPLRMRLCLIQTVKLFLITGRSKFKNSAFQYFKKTQGSELGTNLFKIKIYFEEKIHWRVIIRNIFHLVIPPLEHCQLCYDWKHGYRIQDAIFCNLEEKTCQKLKLFLSSTKLDIFASTCWEPKN